MKYLQVLLFLTIMFSGCKKAPDILFCEGVTPDGTGNSCGTTFTTGDLTALYTSNEPFGVEKLTIVIYEKLGNSNKEMEQIELKVIPEDSRATTMLSFYNEGAYHVAITKNSSTIAEADLKIIDK